MANLENYHVLRITIYMPYSTADVETISRIFESYHEAALATNKLIVLAKEKGWAFTKAYCLPYIIPTNVVSPITREMRNNLDTLVFEIFELSEYQGDLDKFANENF